MNGAPSVQAAPRGSLQRKILLIVMAATLAALLLSAVAMLAYEVRSYRSERISDLSSQAELIAQSVQPTLSFDDPKAATEALSALKLRPQIQQAAIYTADGRLFAKFQAAGDAPAKLPDTLGTQSGTRFDGNELDLFHGISQDGEKLGTLYLRARHELTGRIFDYAWILTLTTTAGLAVAVLIFRKLHPAITGPILAMADVSRRVIEDRRYDLRVVETTDDEVGVLVLAFNNMLRDLSAEMRERHGAEEALRAADRRKDEFLATLAHELRNPLAPLSNALAILKLAGDDDAAVRRRIYPMMERQLAQMVRLIDDLLEVSRITRGKLELRRATVDVVPIASGALEAADAMLRKHQITVQSDLPAAPIWVDADAARLTQVLVNVLHNAAKYTAPQGTVRLRAEAVQGTVRIEIEDNGIGIDASQQQAIFDMFVQVDNSLGRGAAGLGVGLTIARQLVSLHGGTLAVRSEGLGRGSVFIVTLPEVAAPVAAALPVVDDATTVAALKLLVADDNLDFADSFGNLLRLDGHLVRVVHDGNAALRAAIEDPPDAAFVDIGMPGLNGYEVAAQLRRHPPAGEMLLVAVTGWGQASDRQRVHEAGFDHHLVKPVDIDIAKSLLRRLVEGTRSGAAPASGRTPAKP